MKQSKTFHNVIEAAKAHPSMWTVWINESHQKKALARIVIINLICKIHLDPKIWN